jgi:hypothetical protein
MVLFFDIYLYINNEFPNINSPLTNGEKKYVNFVKYLTEVF